MAELHEILAERVTGWRGTAYAHDTHPAIAEILLYSRNEDGSPRYLREPQIRALETYWYLRLVEGTRRIDELYARLIPGVPIGSAPSDWTRTRTSRWTSARKA